VVPQEFTDDQRNAMLKALHEREGRWNEVDRDTEIASLGEGISLSENQSYELFGCLVDEGFVDPGRAYRAEGAMPGSTSGIVGREDNMTVIGDDVRLTIALCSDIGPLLLRSSSVGVSRVPNPPAQCLKQASRGWSNFIDYRSSKGRAEIR
jgi:hypothetical protein